MKCNMSYIYESFPFTFCWKIDNFKMMMPYRSKWLCSPPLRIPFVDRSWKIMLHPNFTPNGYVSVYLLQIFNRQTKENNEFQFTLSVTSVDDSNKKYISHRGNIEKLDCWGSKKFIAWKLLLQEKEIWLPKDTLTIECVIEQYIHDKDSLDSFVSSMNKLYYKEHRYPRYYIDKCFTSQSKHCNIDTLEETDLILYNHSSKIIPGRCYKPPVLHSWFDFLYSQLIDSNSFCDLGKVLEKIILKNQPSWPDVGPRKWVSHLRWKKDSVSFTWFIKDYSRLILYDKFFSPAFNCGSSPWKLMFFLSKDIDESEIAEIFICPMSLYLNTQLIIKCKISVVNRSGRLPLSEELAHLYDNDGQWKFPTFIRNKILNDDKSLFLANDILCLYCTFTTSDLNYECNQSWTAVEYSKAFRTLYIPLCGLLQLREDISALLETGLNSDAILKVGEIEIPAHQSILSERSTELRSQIKYLKKTERCEKMIIVIEDLEVETLQKLLKYIYSGKHFLPRFFKRFRKVDRDLAQAACKYGVDADIMEKYL